MTGRVRLDDHSPIRFPFLPWHFRILATRPPGPAAPDRPRTRSWWPNRDLRQFTAEYRLRILEQADRCTQPGQVGPQLRREGWLGDRT